MRIATTLALLAAAPSMAQATCPGDTQVEMNQCAHATYQQADAELNAVWQVVKPQFDSMGAGDALLDAQRKWIVFRDAACTAEAAPFEGGSIQPLVRTSCMTRLTNRRIEDLRSLTN